MAGAVERMGLVSDRGGRRGHDHKLYINSVRLDEGKFMFSNRVCQQWNELPGEVMGAGSVNGFKRGVEKIFLVCFRPFSPLRAVKESNFSFAVLGMLGMLGMLCRDACAGSIPVYGFNPARGLNPHAHAPFIFREVNNFGQVSLNFVC